MLARCQKLLGPDGREFETPLLLPSFSSRGFPNLKSIVKLLDEYVGGPVLISAFDVHHKLINHKIRFSQELLFIDSGGYECGSAADFSDNLKENASNRPWQEEHYKRAVRQVLTDRTPKVIVSYDHPKLRVSLARQIKRAQVNFDSFAKGGKVFLRELLLKPEKKRNKLLPIDTIVNKANLLKPFDIIGVTERELGLSLFERMKNVAKIRKGLSAQGLNTPLHVFGSLDTISTPLYFFCGADIFDGLTWLRYSYKDGVTIYQPNFWAQEMSYEKSDDAARVSTYQENYGYLQELFTQMRTYPKTKDFSIFKHNGDLFKKLCTQMVDHLGEA